MVGIAAIGGLLSGGSSLLSAFGKGKSGSGQQYAESGYQFSPEQKKQIAATLMGLFPRIGEQADRPYIGQLFRRGVDETDTDPIFGSKRRVQWASEMDKLRELIAQQGVGNSPTQAPATASFSPQDEIFIKQYEQGGYAQHPFQKDYNDAIKRRKEAGKVPLPMGGYADSGKKPEPVQNPVTQQGIQANVQDLLRKMMEK